MCITPVAELLVTSQVLSSHVESADESDPPVDDNDLPVVSVIHAKLKFTEKRREKFSHLNSFIFQAFPVPVLHRPASHAVKKDAHLHTLSGFFYKYFFYLLPELVIPDNIILKMNVSFRRLHFLYQRPEFRFSVRIDPDIIVISQNRLACFQIVEDQVLEPRHLRIRQPQALMIDCLFLSSDSVFQFPFYLFRLEHPALVKVLPNHQIQNKSQDRYKIQQKKPCPYRLRRSPLKEHNNQCKEDIYDANIVHNKIIDCHHSIPNCFCHKLFTPLFNHKVRFPARLQIPQAGSGHKTPLYTVYPFPIQKVNRKIHETVRQNLLIILHLPQNNVTILHAQKLMSAQMSAVLIFARVRCCQKSAAAQSALFGRLNCCKK